MSEPTCGSCGRRTPTGHTLCPRCLRTFRTANRNVADLHLDLATVAGRQSRFGAGGRGSDATPLIVDTRFADRTGRGSELVRDTRATLIHWCQLLTPPPRHRAGPTRGHALPGVTAAAAIMIITETRGRTHPVDRPFPRTVGAMSSYLDEHATTVATKSWGPACFAEILDLETRHKRLVDRPAERWYAGVCGALVEPVQTHDGSSCACACHHAAPGLIACDLPGGCGLEYAATEPVRCERVLYVEPGQRTVECRDCGTEHPVEARRDQLLAEAVEREATVETITRIVTTLMGRDVSAARLSARIRQWAQRGRIRSHGERVVDGRPRPVYRVGDVTALLAEDQATKAG